MFSAITSYIWGAEDDQVVPDCSLKINETKTDEEWILVDLSACDNEVEGKISNSVLTSFTKPKAPRHKRITFVANF